MRTLKVRQAIREVRNSYLAAKEVCISERLIKMEGHIFEKGLTELNESRESIDIIERT